MLYDGYEEDVIKYITKSEVTVVVDGYSTTFIGKNWLDVDYIDSEGEVADFSTNIYNTPNYPVDTALLTLFRNFVQGMYKDVYDGNDLTMESGFIIKTTYGIS